MSYKKKVQYLEGEQGTGRIPDAEYRAGEREGTA